MNGIQESQKLESARNVSQPIGIEKKCTRCGQTKLLSEFGVDIRAKDGHKSACLVCRKERNRKWYEAHREESLERNHKWYEDHKDESSEHGRKWRKNHLVESREYAHEWYNTHKDYVRKKNIMWRESHPKEYREYSRKYREAHQVECRNYSRKWYREHPEAHKEYRRKRRSTVSGHLNDRIGSSMKKALKGNKAGRHWEELVGYSLRDLRAHIEKQFIGKMSWEGVLRGEIHIDHKIPKSVFNFKTHNDIDFKRCWALSNLQPLWALENIKKSNKLDNQFQPSLLLEWVP